MKKVRVVVWLVIYVTIKINFILISTQKNNFDPISQKLSKKGVQKVEINMGL